MMTTITILAALALIVLGAAGIYLWVLLLHWALFGKS